MGRGVAVRKLFLYDFGPALQLLFPFRLFFLSLALDNQLLVDVAVSLCSGKLGIDDYFFATRLGYGPNFVVP
jgi:hypothetical protein